MRCAPSFLALALAACGGARPARLPPSAAIEQVRATPVSDEDVRRAFAAQPELPAKVRVAYYPLGDELDDVLEETLLRLPRVSSTYRIPGVLVTGSRPLDGAGGAHPPLDVDRLRLLAARAHADVLLVVDYGRQLDYRPNGLVVLGVAIAPLFFTPFQDAQAASYLDGLVYDTRSGYLLGQLSGWREGHENFLTLYSSAGDELIERQREELLDEARARMGEMLAPPRPVAASPSASLPPTTDTEDPWAQTQHLVVVLTGDGAMALNGHMMDSPVAMASYLAELTRGRATTAEVRATAAVSAARLAELLDLLKKVGVRDVAFAVEPPSEVSTAEASGAEKPPEPAPEKP